VPVSAVRPPVDDPVDMRAGVSEGLTMEWNRDGGNVIDVPAGATQIALFPQTKQIRIPKNRPDRAKLEPKLVADPNYARRYRVDGSAKLTIDHFAFPPGVRVTGVVAYYRTGSGTRWEYLTAWGCPEGEAACAAKLARIRAIDEDEPEPEAPAVED
jgi:hypothetical protein